MRPSKELLYMRYIDTIREDSDVFMGIELEFPIVNLLGNATDTRISIELMRHLVSNHDFDVVERDLDGNPIKLEHTFSGDYILFEVSYNTLEMAFAKARTIYEVDKRFRDYLQVINLFLNRYDHALVGLGVNPSWDKNDNSPVKTPRYQMLSQFLSLSEKINHPFLHTYPAYGAFICGNQVQFDINRANLVKVLNVFNHLEPVKAYLFANSSVPGLDWETKLSRDVFWENSMHGIFPENVGMYDRDFKDIDDVVSYMERSSIFTVERDGEILYFEPVRVQDYLDRPSINAYDLNGETRVIYPSADDIKYHRSYYYEELTTRGTVELRSVCTQPLNKTFEAIAFELGAFYNLDKVDTCLQESQLYHKYAHDYRQMRRAFSSPSIAAEDEAALNSLVAELLPLVQEGLEKRGHNEAIYLVDLIKTFESH